MGVLADTRAGKHDEMVRSFLKQFSNNSALEISCGFGRMANEIPDYRGIDFSEEMIRRANNPKCIVADAHEYLPDKNYDVIFEVISLSSLNQTPTEFFERWKKYANKYVICFEVDTFYIFPKWSE